MKISIIGPDTPIPPKGWGAVESLIWDYKITLEKLGHEVQIINIGDPMKILGMIDEFKPDFVHINYDDCSSISFHQISLCYNNSLCLHSKT